MELVKGKMVVHIYGDYCAFHEMGLSVEYIFGRPETMDESLLEYLEDNLELYGVPKGLLERVRDQEGFLSVEVADEIATDCVKAHDGEGRSDYEILDGVFELSEGRVGKWYISTF